MVKSLHTPAYAAFRRLLVDAREQKGLTQAELAKRLDKPQSFVSKYENGERRLDVVELVSVCAALGVEAMAFFESILRESHEYKSNYSSRKRTSR